MLTVYDSQFFQLIASIPDQKGCHSYSVLEHMRSLVLVNKKKLFAYSWQAPGFVLSREYLLLPHEIPKSIQYVCNTYVVMGYKKHYEYLDLITGAVTRLFDVEKEHKMVALQVTMLLLLLRLPRSTSRSRGSNCLVKIVV